MQIIPHNARKIIDMMEKEIIPMKIGDVAITGDDIMEQFNIMPGYDLGNIIIHIYQEALMNKYNWKSKKDTLKYLKTI